MLVTMILTGIFLAMNYTPHATMAFDSVEHIMRDVNYGWLIRYMHMNGASFFFIAVYIHIFRGMYYGSYKAPREVLWWIGLLILLAMMGDGLHGLCAAVGPDELLGRDRDHQHVLGYPARRQGDRDAAVGRFAVDNPTLNRFFSLHYLLPFVICALVFLHIWALHIPVRPSLGIEVSAKDKIPFHPYYTAKDAFGLGAFLLFFFAVVVLGAEPAGRARQLREGQPAADAAAHRAGMVLLPFYAILRAIPNKLLGVLAMFGAILIMFVIPWLDTSRIRSPPSVRVPRVLLDIPGGLRAAHLCGAQLPEGIPLILGRLGAAWYFLNLIIRLPVIGWLETPKRCPPVSASRSSAQP